MMMMLLPDRQPSWVIERGTQRGEATTDGTALGGGGGVGRGEQGAGLVLVIW